MTVDAICKAPRRVRRAMIVSSALERLARLLIKRDDAIAFGFGGNKVRKLHIVAAQALAEGADTLITTGGVQSNHARATAAIAARLGLGCVLVANGVAAYARAVGELLGQASIPDVIVLSTSSGGTLAGVLAGCRLHDLPTRVI